MYEMAIDVHGLDPARSLFVGDRWRDVIPAAALGGLGIMLDVESTPDEDRQRARDEAIAIAALARRRGRSISSHASRIVPLTVKSAR